MAFRWRRTYLTALDVEECQRRVWLLAASTVGLTRGCGLFVYARADGEGCLLWIAQAGYSTKPHAGSPFAVRGRWRPTPAGTLVETRPVVRLWFLAVMAIPIAALALLATLRIVARSASRLVVGDAMVDVAVALAVWIAAAAALAVSELAENCAGSLLAHQLKAVELPSGADPSGLPPRPKTSLGGGPRPKHSRR